MTADYRELQHIISKIKADIDNHSTKKIAPLAHALLTWYFSGVALDDMKSRSPEEWSTILQYHLKLMLAQKQDEDCVVVFNPDVKVHGFASSHSIIMISHDDIPFLVDSVRMVLDKNHYEIHFIIHFGGMKIGRDKNGKLETIFPIGTREAPESAAPLYIEIDRIVDPVQMRALENSIKEVLHDVRIVVSDWRSMLARAEDTLSELEETPPGLDSSEVSESRDFLQWLINNHFTFMGAMDYRVVGTGKERALEGISGTGLGIMRDGEKTHLKTYADMTPQARKIALMKNILTLSKTKRRSTVHRSEFTDSVSVKRYNAKGEMIGVRRFIGLYTSTAYHSSPRQIPFLRRKVDQVIQSFGFPHDSHDGKEVVHILETLPRDDLFQATDQELYEMTKSILHLKERKRVKLIIRQDALARFYSCLVYVPREVFNTGLAETIQGILLEEFHGEEANYTTYFSDSVLARLHYIVRVNPQEKTKIHLDQIEKRLVYAARSWVELLKRSLLNSLEEADALATFQKYGKAFSPAYFHAYTPDQAVIDITKMETLSKESPVAMLFDVNHAQAKLSLKIFNAESPLILSDVIPVLENMGLRILGDRPYEVRFRSGEVIFINDFEMAYDSSKLQDISSRSKDFQEAFIKVWYGTSENDKLNRLVLEANLNWHEVSMLRSYKKYLMQIGFGLSQPYIEQTLILHSEISQSLVQLFDMRFNPDLQENEQRGAELIKQIEAALDNVSSLDEDRIFRKMLELIQATLRTNYYQFNGDDGERPCIVFKFSPDLISDLPLPRPKFEIFVYSPRVEGVHLRAGKVARGGLRWSDRLEDFRTEVLGLMKAQQVKNTVIVPEGAKGGFVVKLPMTANMSREEWQKEGVDCYRLFISGLLDVTDNIVNGKVIPPNRVIRYDGDDPYFVVAADKGTATFSDIANGIARDYQFWLGDAFASGGSQGYDHKKMGITSRGVWVSVKRHFREFGKNPEVDPFTVVGIGDLSGDVFGNGMLLSKTTKLVAAFNHMHIFLDPNPDMEQSYDERKRIFSLPRSTWTDYNPALISQGGGIYSRSLKSILLSKEVKELLQVEQDSMMPNDLIKAILKAPVDLIWNGGIGTFFKASTETHADVGDRTNDNIRINASDVLAKVIAEGGNLGLTQRARVEYSLKGGIVNTDFIDNSAGVDCSDHEVNIKILFSTMLASHSMSLKERNALLEKMTQEVADLVLQDNYEQTQMLNLEASVAMQTMDIMRHYMLELERAGKLDRELEYLPDDKTMLQRKADNQPLTRPEIAVLMAYCKMYLKQSILQTSLPEDSYFDKYLVTAFPKILRERYFKELKQHQLHREIVATQLCKAITDRMGINFVERLQRETGASYECIIRAFVIADQVFDMEDLWHAIMSLDYHIPVSVQYDLMLQVYYLVRRATRWFIKNMKGDPNITDLIVLYKKPVQMLVKQINKILDARGLQEFSEAVLALKEQAVPDKLAFRVATCKMLFTALDIIEASNKHQLPLDNFAKMYFSLGDHLELNWLREVMSTYRVENQWDELARAGFRDDIDRVQRQLSSQVLRFKIRQQKEPTLEQRIHSWMDRYHHLVTRWRELLAEIKSSDSVDFVTYSVALRELLNFAETTV